MGDHCPPRPRGVGLLIQNRYGELLFIRETKTKPHFGKYAGMWSLPMETLLPGETHAEGLARLLAEEVPWLTGCDLATFPEHRGEYRVAPRTWLILYAVRVLPVFVHPEAEPTEEIAEYRFIRPQEALALWLRQGVPEILADYLRGEVGVRRAHFRAASREAPVAIAAE